MKKTGAHKISYGSGPVNTSTWPKVLWKMACGFFHIVCPTSLIKSGRTQLVIDESISSIAVRRENIRNEKSGEPLLLFEDIFSQYRIEEVRRYAAARLYSIDSGNTSYVYCELDVLSALSFPRYTLRIPNQEGHTIDEVLFSVNERPKHLGQDFEPIFVSA
jgi:hypothetical protein